VRRGATLLHELHFACGDGRRARIRVTRACSFAARLRGLIGRTAPESGHGLWIEPCSAVHTFGVPDALDLVFVSACMVVQRIEAAVPPRRVRIGAGARRVLELRAGEAARIGLRAGTRLEWSRAAPTLPLAADRRQGGNR